MCENLANAKSINSLNLMLDEKKCSTMKASIEHIQSLLRDALGISHYDDLHEN